MGYLKGSLVLAPLNPHCLKGRHPPPSPPPPPPPQWVSDIQAAGGNQYTFHLEATADPRALIHQIRAAGPAPPP